ncbi:MAG: high frequency lysogenization protein HflD [Plesiomonas sp.]|uniref:high frequency lysogenization protein HflD n=1 Tax=Plesiomonas sp. TaxID=2486279 RepID=UPI003EE4C9A7
MAKNTTDVVIALSGMCQAVRLVQEIARDGNSHSEALRASLHSILQTSPTSTLAVFDNEPLNLRLGLETLINQLSGMKGQQDSQLTRYLIGLIILEKKLSARKDSVSVLSDRITRLDRQLAHFDLLDEQMVSAVAEIYVDVISPLGPRIQVTGNPTHLQNSLVQSRIRACLLAGIRAAVLWRQVGGSRLQLVFSRGKLAEQAKRMLAEL